MRIYIQWHGATRSNTKGFKVPFSAKMTKMPLVNPGLTESQNPNKTTFFMVLYKTRAPQSFLATMTNFNQVQPGVDS